MLFLTFQNIINYTAPIQKKQGKSAYIKLSIRFLLHNKKGKTKLKKQVCLTLIYQIANNSDAESGSVSYTLKSKFTPKPFSAKIDSIAILACSFVLFSLLKCPK